MYERTGTGWHPRPHNPHVPPLPLNLTSRKLLLYIPVLYIYINQSIMIMASSKSLVLGIISAQLICVSAWTSSITSCRSRSSSSSASGSPSLKMSAGYMHGQGSCFMPIKQLPEDYYAPRIVQIAGAYPGVTREEFMAVQSDDAAIQGQWNYDFSDPDGPQLGTVAIDGSSVVAACEDAVVIIAEHTTLNISLNDAITEPVDIVVLVDRSLKTFAERKFLVTDNGSGELQIGAYQSKSDLVGEILGHVVLTQVPWLKAMGRKKTGFMEDEEYF